MQYCFIHAGETKNWLIHWAVQLKIQMIYISLLGIRKMDGNSLKHVFGNNICHIGETLQTFYVDFRSSLPALCCMQHFFGRKEGRCKVLSKESSLKLLQAY